MLSTRLDAGSYLARPPRLLGAMLNTLRHTRSLEPGQFRFRIPQEKLSGPPAYSTVAQPRFGLPLDPIGSVLWKILQFLGRPDESGLGTPPISQDFAIVSKARRQDCRRFD